MTFMIKKTINTTEGYSLKKRPLLNWIYGNKLTQPFVAKRIHMSPNEFKRRIREQIPFNQKQIRDLIYFMGAEAAFNVLYFPTNEEKKRVYREVFGGKDERGENKSE